MTNTSTSAPTSRRLMQLGAILILLGLLTGLIVPLTELPRMALASHLEGVLNGMLFIVLGLVWERLTLGVKQRAIVFWAVVYAGFANWFATLFSSFTGAAKMMPLAGGGSTAAPPLELFVTFLLLSLSLAMVIGIGLVAYGLRPVKA